jgi:hypothetical protein
MNEMTDAGMKDIPMENIKAPINPLAELLISNYN